VPLRIAFDLDGTLADMEGELVRQAEKLFGPEMTRRLQDNRGDAAAKADADPKGEAVADASANAGSRAVASEAPAYGAIPGTQAAVEAAPDNTPPMLRLNLTARQQRKLWHHVEKIENFWQSLVETEPGIVARLAALAADRRWEIIFLTKRPQSAGATAQLQTQRWLESMGFTLPSVYVVQGSRGRIAAALGLDIVVDDRPENCLDVVVDSKARAILVWRDDEQQLPGAARRLGIGVVKSISDCLDILTELDSKQAESPRVIDRVKRMLGLASQSASV
jgi:phosphoglycolate phosphatase-like HAD superfamily hydrolase